jgi:hypothetical protein
MATEVDIETLTLEELQAELVTLGDRLSRVDGRRRAIVRLMAKRQAAARAKATLTRLSDEEKAALRVELGSA